MSVIRFAIAASLVATNLIATHPGFAQTATPDNATDKPAVSAPAEADKAEPTKVEPTKAEPAKPAPENLAPDKSATDKPSSDKPEARQPAPALPWTMLAPLPEPASGLEAIAVNGRLYAFGGIDGIRPRGLAFEYDPATNIWMKKKAMPVALHRFAIATYGDRIYLFGGYKYPDSGANGWQPVELAWMYDPAGDTWSPLAAMPAKRGSAVAAALTGKIYVVGGATTQPDTPDTTIQPARRHAIVATVDEYDIAANRWRTLTAMPTARAEPAAAVVSGKIYVAGGRISSAFADDGSDTDVVEAFDPARNQWSRPLTRLPAPLSAPNVAVWRNRIILAGGERLRAADAPATSAAVISYNSEKDRWSPMQAQISSPRAGAAGALIGDRFYLVGGTVPPAPMESAPDGKPTIEGKPPAKPVTAATASAALDALNLDLIPQ